MTPDSNFLSPKMYLAKLSRESYFCVLRKNYRSFHFLFKKSACGTRHPGPELAKTAKIHLFCTSKM